MYPENWKDLPQKNPAVHQVLQRIAEAQFSHGEPGLSAADPGVVEALDLGFVEWKESRLGIVDSQLREAYLLQHAVHVAKQSWADVGQFLETIDEVNRTGHLLGHGSLAARVLLVLANEGADLVRRLGEIADLAARGEANRHRFWSLYAPYCQVLPALNPVPEQLAVALDPVVELVAGDFASGEIVKAIKRFAGQSQATAEALFQAFVARPGARSSSLAGAVLQSLAGFDLELAHQYGLALTENEDPVLRATGILALGDLPYNDADALREVTMARLVALAQSLSPETGRALAHAFGAVLPDERAAKALVELAGHDDPAVQHALAESLIQRVEKFGSESWFAEALLRLAAGSKNPHTVRLIDVVTAQGAGTDPETALSVIASWASAGGLGPRSEAEWKLADTFPSTLRELRKNAVEVLEAAITRWFVSDNRRLHYAASELVTSHDFDAEWDARPPLRLSAAVLNDLGKPMMRLLVLRILGYVMGGQPLAALLVSVLHRNPCPPTLSDFVGEALDYALYNYPGGAGSYLQAITDSSDAPQLDQEVARAALERSETYAFARRALPRLAELTPPSRRTLLFHIAQQKRQAEAIEAARDQSAFLQLVKRVPLKYGRGFSIDRDGMASSPTELNSFSYEVEVPRGEVTDPLGQTMLRLNWRNEGVSEAEAASDTETPDGANEA